ncbi:MAG: RagB/SusD family nutrient uptake outer membrane protein [Cyclobacteriaceae bacterium]|nr:RagB/SusD family nutrient uptake outer membrane protein [Cyclobacteriaceae bacterium]
MKTKNIIIKIVVVLMLSNLIACNEEFLDRQPLDKFTENDVFSTEESLETFVNRIYNQQYTVGTLDWWWRMTFELFYSPLTDESHGKFDFWHFKEVISGGLTPDNMGVFINKWSISYQGIRNCNLFFKNIPISEEAGVSPEAIARLSDEVRLLRAIIYHDLLKHFGGVPIADQVYDLNNLEIIPRNTPKEVSDYILATLDTVIANGNLPGSYFDMAMNNKGRGTVALAHALKSRVALYAASPLFNTSNDASLWDTAAKASLDAINYSEAQGHGLYDDYQGVFLDDYNMEVIFDKSLHSTSTATDLDNTIDRDLNANGYGGWTSMSPTQDFIEAYETADGLDIEDLGSGYTLDKFWENRDPRFYATVLYDGAMWKDREVEVFLPGGLDSRDGPEDWNTSRTGYYWKKLLDESVPKSELGGANRGTQNKVEFRMAELYLNYAETQIALGNEDKAIEYIDLIRSRPGVDMPSVSGLSGQALLDKYRNERRIELVLEGHRFHDLRRWDMYYETLNGFEVERINITKAGDGTKSYSIGLADGGEGINKYVIKPENELIPIPRNEINKSEGIIKQNPGYN